MISGGGTVRALAEELVHKGICEIYLGVSHNLCVGNACALLSDLHSNYSLKKVIVTNSIPQTPEFTALPFVSVRCLSDTLATVITHIHREQAVSEVFYQPE